MEREIKFRVWDKTYKLFLPTEIYDIHSRTSFKSFGIMRKNWKTYCQGEYFYDEGQILEQFTGRKDDKGTEVYEGDLVKYWGGIDPVVFDEGAYKIKHGGLDYFDLHEAESVLVIGNIHEKQL